MEAKNLQTPQAMLPLRVGIPHLKELIKLHVRETWAPDSPGVFVVGPPGVGKTAASRQAVAELGQELGEPVGLKDIRLTEVTPLDTIGLPYHDKNTNRTRYALSELLPGPDDPRRGVVVFDELPNANPSVQTAVYKACTEHAVGPHPLPPGWWVVLMGNRFSDRGNVFPVPKPLVNRVTVLEVEASVDDYLGYMLPYGLAPEIHAYLRQNPGHLLMMDYSPDPMPYPTPRAWTYLSWHLRRMESRGLNERGRARLLPAIAQGQVGPAIGTQFVTYREHFRVIPDAEAIIEGRAAPSCPAAPDAAWALAAALVQHVPRAQTLKHFVAYLDRMPTDLQVYIVRDAVRTARDPRDVTRKLEVQDTKPLWDRWCASNKEFLAAVAAHSKTA